MLRRLLVALFTFVLMAAACGDDDEPAPTAAPTAAPTVAPTAAPNTTPTPTTEAPAPAMGPAEVVFNAQESDGSSIVVASVTLPSPGFIAVHGNAGGSPGPVVGHSALLPAGTSTNVEVTLDVPLATTDLLFPMAHVDVNGNGEYEFFPPDTNVDGPARTADGAVAVVGAEVTVAEVGAAGPVISIEGFSFGEPTTVAIGETLTVRNLDGVAHTWTADAGAFDSNVIPGGQEFTFVFDAAGEYTFFCRIHPSMTGSITVTG